MGNRRRLYIYPLILEGKQLHLLWRDGDDGPDEVLVEDDGCIALYSSEALARDAAPEGDEVATESGRETLDLDKLSAWCRRPVAETVDCHLVLDAWNLFSDVPDIRNDPSFRALEMGANKQYEKVFFGCNLPAVTPEGEHYVPTWSEAEIQKIRDVLVAGFERFQSRVRR